MNTQKILILGAGGMLARALAEALRARGTELVALDRAACDITRSEDVVSTLDRHRPTAVINCSAYTNVDLCEKNPEQANAVNGTGPGNLADACGRFGSTLVHFSTDYVFDGSPRRPLRPEDPTGPASAYGISKLRGEQLIQKNPPPRWLIIRTAWLYGPGGNNFVETMLKVARAGKPLRVVNDQVGCPTNTHDLAAATLELLDRNASDVWHISNTGKTTWFDFARAIFEEYGLSPDLQPITSADWKTMKPDSAPRPAYSVLDTTAYANLAGKPMPDWRAALRKYRAGSGG